MASLLTRKLSSMRSLFPSFYHHNPTIFTPPLFHFSTQILQKEEDQLPFIAQYLISSFGFSKDRALKVAMARQLQPIKTPDRPESVLRFLKEHGLTETEIKTLISWNPQFLCSNVERILKPRFNELATAGFGGNTFIELIKSNPLALNSKSTLPALQFWKKFVNNSEEALLKVIRNNPGLMNVNIDKKIVPRMNSLREYGLSDQQIATLVMKARYFIRREIGSIKLLLEQTENFGFQKGSRMFVPGLIIVATYRKDVIERKIEFFKKTYDLSEQDVKLAIVKCPNILTVSEENVKSTIDVLIKKFGFDLKSVALRPSLLTLSVNKRLLPRDRVVNLLKSKGVEVNYSFQTVILMPENKFVEKFVVAYEKEVPDLRHSYVAFCDE